MAARPLLAFGLVASLLGTAPAWAARRDVLLIVNRQAPEGAAVADAYRKVRDIPASHIVELDIPPAEAISRGDYLARVERPVADWLQRNAAQDDITFLIAMRGVPLRVLPDRAAGTPLLSVDSALALVYRKLVGASIGLSGPVANPLFIEAPAGGIWPAFDRQKHDIYITSRLDGFTVADATSLATRCGAPPARDGRIVLDSRPPGRTPEYGWFALAATRLRTPGAAIVVELDETSEVIRDRQDVVGYFSWAAADPGNRQRAIPLTFAPGAIGASFSSSDARTFTEPPATWQPGGWQQRDRFFEGTAEWLAGDLVRAGLTGWGGAVADPYVDGVVRPHVLFPAYLAGRSLGEAFAAATRYIGWRNVVLGDPLCRPFGQEPEAVSFSRDDASGLTTPFLTRRLDEARRQGTPGTVESIRVRVAANARLAQGDRAGALTLLRTWSQAHPNDLPVQRLRALLLDASGDRDEALAVYRAVLALSPDDLVASNNLAYALASEPASLGEALTLARRAFEKSKGDPSIGDTYGWVLYQTGDRLQAARVLQEVVRRAPTLAEAHLHLALVHLADGHTEQARAAWTEAVRLDPTVAARPEAVPLAREFQAPARP